MIAVFSLYNLEIEKNNNMRQSIEELVKILKELYFFSKKL